MRRLLLALIAGIAVAVALAGLSLQLHAAGSPLAALVSYCAIAAIALCIGAVAAVLLVLAGRS